jgi:hypothetical protein
MAGCNVMQLAHIPGIPPFFIHNGAPQALVGCLDDRFQTSNHTGPSENAAVLRAENNTQLIGFMDSLD